MRTFIGGNGLDSTLTVRQYLASHRSLTMCDLYVINPAPSYKGQYLGSPVYLTDYPAPLIWRGHTFRKADVKRSGIESKIGFDAVSVDVTWSPNNADIVAQDTNGNVLLTYLQAFRHGIFDNGSLEIWRCLMPEPGDAQTLGACLMFEGRIGDIEATRVNVKMKILSRLETLNEMVPTNLVEATNLISLYSIGPNTSFQVQSGSDESKLYGLDSSTPAGRNDPLPGPTLTKSSGGQWKRAEDVYCRIVLFTSEGATWTTEESHITMAQNERLTIARYDTLIPDMLALPADERPVGMKLYVARVSAGAAPPPLSDYSFRPLEAPRYAPFIASHSDKSYIFMYQEGSADVYYPWCFPDPLTNPSQASIDEGLAWFFDTMSWHNVTAGPTWANYPGDPSARDDIRYEIISRQYPLTTSVTLAYNACDEWGWTFNVVGNPDDALHVSYSLAPFEYARLTMAQGAPVFTGAEDNFFDGGYIVMTSGKLAGTYRAVRSQLIVGEMQAAFYLFEPLPFAAATGDTFRAYGQQLRQHIPGGKYAGFPFVPSPINSQVIV